MSMPDFPLPQPGLRAGYGRFLFALLLLALTGALLLLTVTRWGVGLSPDSAVYVAAARNLSQGAGLTVPFGSEINAPLAHHAPFYPMLLALWGWIGVDPMLGARWGQTLLFAVNIALVGALLWRLLPEQKGWGLAAAFFTLIAPPLFALHSMAWTEALFLFLGFAGFAFLSAFLQRATWSLLLLAAVSLGLALLTRYAGVALVGTAVAALLFLPTHPWRARFSHAFLFALVATLPFLLWLLRSRSGGDSIRAFSFHPASRAQIQQGLNTIVGWFLIPDTLPTLLKLALLSLLLLAFGAALTIHYRGQRGQRPLRQLFPPLLLLLFLFAFIYPAFLLLSISFFDANTPLDNRILSPLYVTFLVLLVYAVALVWCAAHRPWRQLAPLLVLACILALGQVRQSALWLRDGYQQGIGFNNVAWHLSPLLQAVRQLDVGTPLYANAPELVNLHTGRPVLRLPRKFESVTQQANNQYPAEMAALKTQLAQEAGVVVYFTTLPISTLPTPAEIIQELSLTIWVEAEDGLLYGPPR